MKLTSETASTVEIPVPPVSQNNKEALQQFTQTAATDYETFKHDFIEWLLTTGKDTYRREGFAESTVKHTHYKVDEAYRWKWDRTGEYTTSFTPEDATTLIDFMMRKTAHPDRYIYSFEKALRRLFKFFREARGEPIPEWDHDIPVDPSRGSADHVKDRFYTDEMKRLYEASLEMYSVRSYHNKNMTSAERDATKALVAQRLGVPKTEVGPEEFKEASSWKIPSILAVTIDCGLRPIEVGRAKKDWFDLDNQLMLVPKKDSTKNEENWECWLSTRSKNALRKWLDERGTNKLYQGEDAMWLTRNGHPYKTKTLNDPLNKLIERADLNTTNRKLSWYSFRHGSATAWCEKEDVYRAKEQLRHKSVETTLKYTRGGDPNGGRQRGSIW